MFFHFYSSNIIFMGLNLTEQNSLLIDDQPTSALIRLYSKFILQFCDNTSYIKCAYMIRTNVYTLNAMPSCKYFPPFLFSASPRWICALIEIWNPLLDQKTPDSVTQGQWQGGYMPLACFIPFHPNASLPCDLLELQSWVLIS